MQEPSTRAESEDTPACYVVSELRDTRVQPRSGLTVRPRRSTLDRPVVARRSVSCHHLAQGSGRARDGKEAADDAHWKGNAQLIAKADSCCGETCPSSQTAKTGELRRNGQRRRGKLRLGRDLHDAGPARLHDGARRFPPNQSGWPVFFALISSFSKETAFTKFVSEEIATARSRHNSRRRRLPMPASPRHRAGCNRHEGRAGVVALASCCLVRLSNGGLALLMRVLSHCQRAHSEVFVEVPL